MTEPYLTMAEMKQRYPNEWVLIGRPTEDRRTGCTTGGHVVIHTPDRAEFDRVVFGAVLYIGRYPEDADLDLPPLARAH